MANQDDQGQDRLIEMGQLKFKHDLEIAAGGNCSSPTGAMLMEMIKKHEMAPLYAALCSQHVSAWTADAALMKNLEDANATAAAKLDETHRDAVENLGESEVREALLAKADHLASIGHKDEAISAYRLTYETTIAIGKRLDIVFSYIRLGFCWRDAKLIKDNIAKAKDLLEEGGDWERRNKLKVYEGHYLLLARQFKEAATILLDCVATFTCYELCTYNDFIFNTIVACVIAVPRSVLKEKVVASPEILTVIKEMPACESFVYSMYNCKYAAYMHSLTEMMDIFETNFYLRTHRQWICRQARAKAYAQFLESYRSVRLDSMAATFGVSAPFLDVELCTYINNHHLSAKVDKVTGIVEMSRPDSKNAQYQSMIKTGDVLLNRMQKLSRVIDM